MAKAFLDPKTSARLSRDKYELYCSNNTRGGGVPFAKIDKLSMEI